MFAEILCLQENRTEVTTIKQRLPRSEKLTNKPLNSFLKTLSKSG